MLLVSLMKKCFFKKIILGHYTCCFKFLKYFPSSLYRPLFTELTFTDWTPVQKLTYVQSGALVLLEATYNMSKYLKGINQANRWPIKHVLFTYPHKYTIINKNVFKAWFFYYWMMAKYQDQRYRWPIKHVLFTYPHKYTIINKNFFKAWFFYYWMMAKYQNQRWLNIINIALVWHVWTYRRYLDKTYLQITDL